MPIIFDSVLRKTLELSGINKWSTVNNSTGNNLEECLKNPQNQRVPAFIIQMTKIKVKNPPFYVSRN